MVAICPCLKRLRAVLAAIWFLMAPLQAAADTMRVATAANFADVMDGLAPLFGQTTGHEFTLVTGSTGKLYAQIVNGAPFHVFLAADQKRPRLLEEEDVAVAGSRFTYAIGRLVLWSRDAALIGDDARAALTSDAVRHIAIANPALAPYGAAARETLEWLGLWEALSEKIVMGDNIGQAFSMVATGNAELGFVAYSALVATGDAASEIGWHVPGEAHAPIRQDAVLLVAGRDNEAAEAFLAFLASAEARAVIARFGYDVE